MSVEECLDGHAVPQTVDTMFEFQFESFARSDMPIYEGFGFLFFFI